jgi:hypothetical protein
VWSAFRTGRLSLRKARRTTSKSAGRFMRARLRKAYAVASHRALPHFRGFHVFRSGLSSYARP